MEINKDFKEFIELLNGHEVKYLVIGGYAVNFHGYPRYTKDIDFWIWMKRENIGKLIEAIKDFGFGTIGLQEEDFLAPNNVVQLGYEPYRIDLLVDLDNSDFESCFAKRSVEELEGTLVNFIGLDDLISVKKRAGRLQDLADAEQLEKINRKKRD
jgi:predicted nucleotidyltransferase